jgi:hypothetical protein
MCVLNINIAFNALTQSYSAHVIVSIDTLFWKREQGERTDIYVQIEAGKSPRGRRVINQGGQNVRLSKKADEILQWLIVEYTILATLFLDLP